MRPGLGAVVQHAVVMFNGAQLLTALQLRHRRHTQRSTSSNAIVQPALDLILQSTLATFPQ